jgi:hypothetical protein
MVGTFEGANVGVCEGEFVGTWLVGDTGLKVGILTGESVGASVTTVGVIVGAGVGVSVTIVGVIDGPKVGVVVGVNDGEGVGGTFNML